MLKRSEWLSFGETAAFAMTGDFEFAISVDEPRGPLFEGQLADWHMVEDDEGNRRPFRSFDIAGEAMLDALRSGLVRAIGVPAGRGDASPSPINADAWSSLRFDVCERETVAFEADLEAFSGLRFQFVDVARHLEPPIVVGRAKLRTLRIGERSAREASFLAEMAESDDEAFPVEDEAELGADRIAMSLPAWTLNQTLAWIATRKPEAVGRDEGEAGLSVWMDLEEALGRPIDFPLPKPGDAWSHLAMALAQRKLAGFSEQVRRSRMQGVLQHSLGVPFPPEDQAGFALGCSVFDGDLAVVAPTDRARAASWDEFHALTFAREDVVRLWPPLPLRDWQAEPAPAMNDAPDTLVDLSETEGDPTPPPARRRGAPSYADKDAQAIERMQTLMGDGTALTTSQAASIVVAEGGVVGLGTEDSKIRRLQRRFDQLSE